MLKTKKQLEDNLEKIKNVIFPSNEGDGIEHIDMNYKEFISAIDNIPTDTIKAIIEDLEEMKKSFYVGAGACYKNEAKEATLNDIADNLKELINPKEVEVIDIYNKDGYLIKKTANGVSLPIPQQDVPVVNIYKEEIGCSNCGELLKESEIELCMCKECMEREDFGNKFGGI
jgi:hypothetical protein